MTIMSKNTALSQTSRNVMFTDSSDKKNVEQLCDTVSSFISWPAWLWFIACKLQEYYFQSVEKYSKECKLTYFGCIHNLQIQHVTILTPTQETAQLFRCHSKAHDVQLNPPQTYVLVMFVYKYLFWSL